MNVQETLELVDALDLMGQDKLADWVLERSVWDDWAYIQARWEQENGSH